MRSLYSDSAYFDYLDGICTDCQGRMHFMVHMLVAEYPALRVDEARAVYCDWRNAAMWESGKRHAEMATVGAELLQPGFNERGQHEGAHG